MRKKSHAKFTAAHRSRAKSAGLTRVEVQLNKADAALIKRAAKALRAQAPAAKAVREALATALEGEEGGSGADLFASGLPDSYFEEVFGQAREKTWRHNRL